MWNEQTEMAFIQLKESMYQTPVLRLPDFSKMLTLETDMCKAGVGAVLMQEGQPLEFFQQRNIES